MTAVDKYKVVRHDINHGGFPPFSGRQMSRVTDAADAAIAEAENRIIVLDEAVTLHVKRLADARAESERLKCCGNCAAFRMWPDYFPRCDVLNREYDAEDVGGRWPDPSGKCVCPGASRWAERAEP